jgi:hypothetical protein
VNLQIEHATFGMPLSGPHVFHAAPPSLLRHTPMSVPT